MDLEVLREVVSPQRFQNSIVKSQLIYLQNLCLNPCWSVIQLILFFLQFKLYQVMSMGFVLSSLERTRVLIVIIKVQDLILGNYYRKLILFSITATYVENPPKKAQISKQKIFFWVFIIFFMFVFLICVMV